MVELECNGSIWIEDGVVQFVDPSGFDVKMEMDPATIYNFFGDITNTQPGTGGLIRADYLRVFWMVDPADRSTFIGVTTADGREGLKPIRLTRHEVAQLWAYVNGPR